MRYQARAPLRIDFGGGWTDVPVYAEREGGAVLNAAITLYARGWASRPRPNEPLHLLRGDRSHVHYTLDTPIGSGLGGSAAQTVLWVTLVRSTLSNTWERADIADTACRVAAALGIIGGKQDEYASALGGVTYFTFGEAVHPEPLHLGSGFAGDLRSRLVLVHSGVSHLSSEIHEHVWDRFRTGEREVVLALAGLRQCAAEMKGALLAHDLDGFGRLMNENWTHQKALHPSVSSPQIDEIMDFALTRGAIGGKACGAGGGGCLVFLSAEGTAPDLRKSLQERGLRVFDFDFDTYGVHLSRG